LAANAIAQRLPVSVDEVVRVWRARETATRSLRFEMAGQYRQKTDSLAGPEALEYTETSERRLVVIDGSNMRHERAIAATWHNGARALLPVTVIAVSDGKIAKVLDQQNRNDDVVHSEGFIRDGRKPHRDANNLFLSPIIRHFRPTSPAFSAIRVNGLTVSNQDSMAGGMRCVLLEEALPDGQRRRLHWVAPEQDMAIVRSAGYLGRTLEHQVDASFKRDAVFGWIPDRWNVVLFFEKETIASSAASTVTSRDVNPQVSAETFDIKFPPGTQVFDKLSHTSFVVRDDSSHRQIRRRDVARKLTYSQLMNPDFEPDDAADSTWLPSFRRQ
jgi:hypothetical protein